MKYLFAKKKLYRWK